MSKPMSMRGFYSFSVPDRFTESFRSKSTPPLLPPLDTGRSISKQSRSKRDQTSSSLQFPDPLEGGHSPGRFGRKVGFGPARKRAFPRPLPIYSKHLSVNPKPATVVQDKDKAGISTTLRELPNIYQTGMVSPYTVHSNSSPNKPEEQTKEFNLKELDLAHKIRERIQQFKKWQKDNEKKARHIPGTYLENAEFSERERNVHGLKLSSIFRDELANHDNQHVSRTLNLGDMIKHEQINLDQVLLVKKERTEGDDDLYPISSTGSARTGSSPARMPEVFALERERTMKTWRTWRGPDESYAYSDVRRYIEENELLSEDKEQRINEWIDDVHDARCVILSEKSSSEQTQNSEDDLMENGGVEKECE